MEPDDKKLEASSVTYVHKIYHCFFTNMLLTEDTLVLRESPHRRFYRIANTHIHNTSSAYTKIISSCSLYIIINTIIYIE